MRCDCGTHNPPEARFCNTCGKALSGSASVEGSPAGAAATPEPVGREPERPVRQATATNEASRRDQPRRRRGCCGCGCFVPILVLIVLAAGGYYWLSGPDLPPRPWEIVGDRIVASVSKNLGGRVPFIDPPDKPLPKLDPQLEKEAFDTARKTLQSRAPKPGPTEQKEAQLRTLLETTRLPITVVSIMETDAGQSVLAVGVKYSDLAGPVSTSGGLAEGLNAFQRLVDTKTLSLAGLHDLTVAVEDDQGRVLFGVSAPVAAIESYRAGKLTRQELVRSVGFKGESRIGVLETFGKGVTQ